MRGRASTPAAVVVVVCMLAAMLTGSQDVLAAAPGESAGSPGFAGGIPVEQREALLGQDYRTSGDLAWALSGGPGGLEVLAAPASSGYTWSVRATLAEPGLDTDQWLGNACLTSGGQLLVVYAPRTFTNRTTSFDLGGFVALVDLASGAVRKLDITASLVYSNPTCGHGDTATLLQFDHREDGTASSRVVLLDTARGQVAWAQVIDGEVTGATPTAQGALAARGGELLLLPRNGKPIAQLAGDAFRLYPTGAGTVAFLRRDGTRDVVVSTVDTGTGAVTEAGRGRLSEVSLRQGRSGVVTLVGPGAAGVTRAAGLTRTASDRLPRWVSSTGALATVGVTVRPGRDAAPTTTVETALRNGATPMFTVPAATGDRSAVAGGLSPARDDPVDSGATCAIPRNDLATQVHQPNPRQVEWAADQAILGTLTVSRPANWKRSGLPAYTPQGMFPPVALRGGGRIPAQILLGILAQESNLWQASYHAKETWTGNPLIGDYYGYGSAKDWFIDWSHADCGYGVGQITTGMRKTETILTATQKRAIAIDYAANIARAAQMLAQKWNQLYDAGIIINGGRPDRLEPWFGAVWAYNSGFYAPGNDPWGLGWTNNPRSGLWDPQRGFFMERPSDAAHPQDWPYPEKVIGWGAFSIDKGDLGPGFRTAWWLNEAYRSAAKPPIDQFCTAANECDPARPTGANCTRSDFKCWWHDPTEWKDCSPEREQCGHPLTRFDSTYPEPQPSADHSPPDPEQNAPPCTNAGLPSGALVVDNVPDGTYSRRVTCTAAGNSAGTFTFTFATDAFGAQVSKIDLHQVGLGYWGHTWFAHTRTRQQAELEVIGTWRLGRSLNSWARVLVHLPEVASHTQQAKYTIDTGGGSPAVVTRYLNASNADNDWVSLGAFRFGAGTPKVSLSNITWDGTGKQDIAWDAVAFQPLPRKPAHFIVAMGDSYGSGEGASDYQTGTNHDGDDPANRNACHRSANAWSRKLTPPGLGTTVGAATDAFNPALDFAFVSCSGAVTSNLMPGHAGQYGEVAELDAGYLSADTTQVLVSIGGNDARFSAVIEACIVKLNCPEDTLEGDTAPLNVAEPALIRGPVQDRIKNVLRAIHERAPNAAIVLVGYPRLFDGWGAFDEAYGCIESHIPMLSGRERDWLNDMSVVMRTAQQNTAAQLADEGISVAYADTIPEFAGRGICTLDAHVNPIIVSETEGDPPGAKPSAESYHPNPAGTTDYARAVRQALNW